MNVVRIEKILHFCHECEDCKQQRYPTPDAFEAVDLFTCAKTGNKIGVFDWNEIGKRDTIPDWCPLIAKDTEK